MNATLYLGLKALHVAAAMTFVGGVIGQSLILRLLAGRALQPDARVETARLARRFERAITTPAMLTVWVLGLTLASTGGWFAMRWLWAKLVFVLILSALHGLQSGRLRRLAMDGSPAGRSRDLLPVVIVCIAFVAGLAVVKPF